jgi:lysophospholipase L1-like esterase
MRPAMLALSLMLLACGVSHRYRYLALGDSYTIGQSVPESARWPVQLVARLRMKGLDPGDPQIIARTGWTTSELTANVNDASPGSDYDLVTLLVGVNDQYRGSDPKGYRPEFAALLKQAVGFARGKADHVIVVSIPDWGATPHAEGQNREQIGRAIDVFNAINREEALKAGARYVDITPISRDSRTLVAGDGLHPSAEMYAKWVDLIEPEAVAILKKPE